MDKSINIKAAISDLNMALCYIEDLANEHYNQAKIDHFNDTIDSYIETANQELTNIREDK